MTVPYPSPDDEPSDLWALFKSSADPQARDGLILQYLPLVKFVAGRVAVALPGDVDESNLVSNGVLGLIEAIDKFAPDRGFNFDTYAIYRIKSAILDGERDS